MAVRRREVKSKGEKERYKHLNAEFQRIARRDKKAFLSNQCKLIGENNRRGKTRDFPILSKFKLKLKKVGKTTRPLRYDLNQIHYDYTVEVGNRFKGLDLIECLMNYEAAIKTISKKKKCNKGV